MHSAENVALLRRCASVDDEHKVESSDDVTDLHAVYKWMRLGFNLDSATKIASASVCAEARHLEGHPTFVIAKQAFVSKYVSVSLSDLEPSPEFTTAVKDAMSSSSPEERKEALDGVMDRWGQFIATSVELGCAIVASKETRNVSTLRLYEQDALMFYFEGLIPRRCRGLASQDGDTVGSQCKYPARFHIVTYFQPSPHVHGWSRKCYERHCKLVEKN